MANGINSWDNYYQNDLDQDDEDDESGPPGDPADLESWFDDVGAPAKVLEYLTSDEFPFSPNNPHCKIKNPNVLDLGTGNGSMLFMLRMEGGYEGTMVGIDYSQQSVDLARKLWSQYSHSETSSTSGEITFETVDLIREDSRNEQWWPYGGFNLVLDKGTFDAISLSSEMIRDVDGQHKRICELYPQKAIDMVAPDGYLLITSCNWTEEEVIKWFSQDERIQGQVEFFGRIDYPVYEFGGQQGSGVASVCFRKIGSA